MAKAQTVVLPSAAFLKAVNIEEDRKRTSNLRYQYDGWGFTHYGTMLSPGGISIGPKFCHSPEQETLGSRISAMPFLVAYLVFENWVPTAGSHVHFWF